MLISTFLHRRLSYTVISGCLNLVNVLRTLAAQSPTAAHNSDNPSSAFIFDSSPGLPSILKNVRAVTAGIPSPLIRRVSFILGSIVSAFHLSLTYLVSFLLRRPDIWTRMRSDLVDPAFIPLSAPRLYVYSTKDKMVGWRDVEKHVTMAKERGVKTVLVKKDEKAGHVNHLKVDAVGYWAAVKRVWSGE